MKIMLGVDASPLADETVSTVCRTFGPTKASVIVLSVIGSNEPETAPSPVLLASVAQNLAVLEADQVRTHEDIVARAERTLQAAGLATTGRVEYGDPRHVLVAAARSHDVDIVVVGSHGHSAFRRFVMGSVASHVVTHAPCNVLVVRHPHLAAGAGHSL
jgi:nucleotide-binding universal stress UspA family protein